MVGFNQHTVTGEQVVDPYEHYRRFENWKKEGRQLFARVKVGKVIEEVELSVPNQAIICEYINDMSVGKNAGGMKKGARSYTRINTIRSRMQVLAYLFEEHTKKALMDLTEDDLPVVFEAMRKGMIVKIYGEGRYKSTADYVIQFKSFWHWYQRRERKLSKREVLDITIDLDTSKEPQRFVYLTFDDMKKLADVSKHYYKVLLWFLFDSGIRSPTELMNVRKKDVSWLSDMKIYQLNIREETSKTYGRSIKLPLCSEIMGNYIRGKKDEDFLFTVNPVVMNRYLKRLALKMLDGKQTPYPKSELYRKLTMYDLRHCSACYWVSRYNNRSSLLYRFGWKNERMIETYTKFLGMKDTITEQDVIDSEERNKLELELQIQKQQYAVVQDQMNSMQEQMLQQKALLQDIARGDYEKLRKMFEIMTNS